MSCGICGDDDHTEYACELRLGTYRPPDQAGLLPQHRRCWTCKQITHAWDHMPCGQHSTPGAEMPVVDAPPVTPPRDRTRDLQALALAQAAEARAGRGEDLDTWWALVSAVPQDQDHRDNPNDNSATSDHSQQDQPGHRASV